MYWEHPRGSTLFQAVRMGNWKAVRTEPGAALDLYNLAQDAGETTNVAAQHPGIVVRLETYLATARTEPPPYDPEVGTAGWERGRTGYLIE
jgi:arylsulfatase A